MEGRNRAEKGINISINFSTDWLSTIGYRLQFSPDWSGYAILQRRLCSKAIAVRGKQGAALCDAQNVCASKKINV